MKSSNTAVRRAFNTLITGLGYAVYDRQRGSKSYPYVVIGEQTMQQAGDQANHGHIATINIEVVNGWGSNYGSRDVSDAIVNDIMSAVITKPYTLSIDGFDMPQLKLDNAMTSTDVNESHTVITTVLRFSMHLFDNSGTLDEIAIGSIYAGGVIAYIDSTGQHGYVCSTGALQEAPWESDGFYPITGAFDRDNGLLNTKNIISVQGTGNYAAAICRVFYTNEYLDWYLPSIEQLTTIYNNLHVSNIYPLDNGMYWSSTANELTPETIDALNGNINDDGDPFEESSNKSEIYKVLPIRNF